MKIDYTMVDSSLVKPTQYVGEHVQLKGRKVPKKVPLANVWLEVAKHMQRKETRDDAT